MWTKSQKICAAILGLAVVAFGVDRWVIPDGKSDAPSTSEYQVSRTAAPATGQRPAVAVTTPGKVAAAAPQGASLASRLAAASEARRFTAQSVADAFQPAEVWVTANTPPPSTAKVEAARPVAATPKVDHAAQFVQRHVLTAVMKDRSGGMAIINGKLYKVGQYVGGFKLTRVGLTDASFWGKGAGAKLKLAGQFPVTASAR